MSIIDPPFMTFIAEVAEHIFTKYTGDLEKCTVVFPNRRAGLFLKKELSKIIDQPIWAPNVFSLEDYIFQFSTIQKCDALSLVFEVYQAYKKNQKQAEDFASFFHWGEMLLRDFEEIDHYLVDPNHLFTYVKNERELSEAFYFLDAEQEDIIKKFWQEFLPNSSKSQEQFVATWQILLPIYNDFKKSILNKQIGYTSHIYREVFNQTQNNEVTWSGPLVFAGFNALTKAEELLIKYFVAEHKADVLWDVDSYYLENTEQEASTFFRRYQEDKVFGQTFPKQVENRVNKPKKLKATGVSLEVGQAKLLGERIQNLLTSSAITQEEIVVVLPQDYMLFPVLNAIPSEVTKINVTMGYPLKETPLFGLLEAALELQEHKQKTSEHWLTFYHKTVLDILSHPYLFDIDHAQSMIDIIQKNNQIRVLQEDVLNNDSELLEIIFSDVSEEAISTYLLSILKELKPIVKERFGLEQEYVYHFQLMLEKLNGILLDQSESLNLKIFKSLFNKSASSVKIPFGGEPIEGLQIMGALETRNLDFKYIFMLNMNEGMFPASQKTGSFIPYSIRKAFDMSTFETQDAIYAYLFYRLLHRSESLEFFYNINSEFGLSGEQSRFLRQIEHESQLEIEYRSLSNSIQLSAPSSISIDKTADVINRLKLYTTAGGKKLSPSALNVFLDCRLKFYFQYVLRLFSQNELNDELTARDFGNILHSAMEILYKNIIKRNGHSIIQEQDFELGLMQSIDGSIEKAFKQNFKLKENLKFELKGRNSVVAEIMRKFIVKILQMDKAYAPFEIVSLENDSNGNYDKKIEISTDNATYNLVLRGIIDRVDKKDKNIRVIDYKSGKDTTHIGSVENCFNRDSASRNKAGFQTLYYAWLYSSKHGDSSSITPGIFNIQELFTSDFDMRLKLKGGGYIDDARPLLDEFESRFKELLVEIFDMNQPFDQTDDATKCNYCDFNKICNR